MISTTCPKSHQKWYKSFTVRYTLIDRESYPINLCVFRQGFYFHSAIFVLHNSFVNAPNRWFSFVANGGSADWCFMNIRCNQGTDAYLYTFITACTQCMTDTGWVFNLYCPIYKLFIIGCIINVRQTAHEFSVCYCIFFLIIMLLSILPVKSGKGNIAPY